MSFSKKTLTIIAIFLVTIFLIVLSFFISLNSYLNQDLNINKKELIAIAPGMNLLTLLDDFEEKKYIKQSIRKKFISRVYPKYKNIKHGSYFLTKEMSLKSLLINLKKGDTADFSFTIIEGMNIKEVLLALDDLEYIKRELPDYNANDLDKETLQKIAKAIDPKLKYPEGWFFPETYHYSANDSDLALLKRAYNSMQEKLEYIWQKRKIKDDKLIKNKYETLILASIIEKESSANAERGLISSVFYNRLKINMRLQTDPTVIYGIGNDYRDRLYKKDLLRKTKYNTYIIYGLPPTPIAMPSLASLEASVNPDKSDYFYFVSMGNGIHKFSKTLRQHNNAVNKYILGK